MHLIIRSLIIELKKYIKNFIVSRYFTLLNVKNLKIIQIVINKDLIGQFQKVIRIFNKIYEI